MEITEIPAAFGPEGTLVGMLTHAVPSAPASPVGCLLLNTGVNHRIGPRRFNVKTARRLAALGIPSLRFDLSGIGDSRASGGEADFRAQAVLDMRAALDHFQACTGLTRFIIFGICSGASNGLALALADTRIVGLVKLDGEIFLTKGVRIRRKLHRWMAFPFNPALRRSYPAWNDWAAWARAPLDAQARARALQRLHGQATPQSTEETGILSADPFVYAPQDYVRDMQALIDRKVDVYLMHTNTIIAVASRRELLRGLGNAPFLQHIRYTFWPDIDHTVTQLSAQQKLLDTVCNWAQEVACKQQPQTQAAPAQAPSGLATPVATALAQSPA